MPREVLRGCSMADRRIGVLCASLRWLDRIGAHPGQPWRMSGASRGQDRRESGRVLAHCPELLDIGHGGWQKRHPIRSKRLNATFAPAVIGDSNPTLLKGLSAAVIKDRYAPVSARVTFRNAHGVLVVRKKPNVVPLGNARRFAVPPPPTGSAPALPAPDQRWRATAPPRLPVVLLRRKNVAQSLRSRAPGPSCRSSACVTSRSASALGSTFEL